MTDPPVQAKELSRRPHVVIATPGRLRALLEMDADLARGFSRARFLVLDEADRLLEPSFESELAVVLQVSTNCCRWREWGRLAAVAHAVCQFRWRR